MTMATVSTDRVKLIGVADVLAIALAASLPWSTSAASVLAGMWAVTLIAMFDVRALRETVMTPAGGLPVLLVLFGVAGMAWGDVSLAEKWNGIGSFFKLLAIPLFFIHFQRSERGYYVFVAYALSCLALLVVTTVIMLIPPLAAGLVKFDNVIVRNAASQSGEFVLCMFGLLYVAADRIERRHWRWVAAIALFTVGMLVSMFFLSTGRTALVTMPVLLVLFAARRLSRRSAAMVLAAAVALAAIGWFSAPYLRERTVQAWTDAEAYFATDAQNSSGERLEFYRKSLRFVGEAPLFGHGTGSIHKLFIASSEGKTGAEGSATTNPHNQTFAVAIQIGLVGAAVLWAMWIAHLLLFRGPGLAAWVGLAVVAQNIVGSLLNSHLFDFLQGWIYVVGVGVAGGMVLRQRAAVHRKIAAP
ncbi:MAG: O-antigen ligase family protein [Proteobacteria bacterium]|nr:O-antigen ligase family protein [Pseudomonadota bacterium]